MIVFVLRLTKSQRMALATIVGVYLRLKDEPQIFIDCSQAPTVETTSGDLLRLLLDTPWEREKL